MAAPAKALEHFGDRGRAHSGVIKCQQHRARSNWAGGVRQEPNLAAIPRMCNRLKMLLEFRAFKLVHVRVGAGKSAAPELARWNNVVIEQCYPVCRLRAARFQRR